MDLRNTKHHITTLIGHEIGCVINQQDEMSVRTGDKTYLKHVRE